MEIKISDITVFRHSSYTCRHCSFVMELGCGKEGLLNCPKCGCPTKEPLNGKIYDRKPEGSVSIFQSISSGVHIIPPQRYYIS